MSDKAGNDGAGAAPPQDEMRYDLLVEAALKEVVRMALRRVQRSGLPGDHHFYIAFDTRHPGVQLSDRLREKYPEEMTIVLQYQFWGLKVHARHFEVGLSFGGVQEHLVVPFDAITGFFDPSVQFALQFRRMNDDEQALLESVQGAPSAEEESFRVVRGEGADAGAGTDAAAASSADASATGADKAGDEAARGEKQAEKVVKLDAFRKKK